MHLGLVTSLLIHGALLLWALVTIKATPPFKMPEQVPVEVAIVSESDMVRLMKGERNAKNPDAAGNEGVAKVDPKKQPKVTPPPPQNTASAQPQPPEPVEPKKDPIAEQIALAPKEQPKEPVKAAVPAGPSPEDKKKLDDAIKAEDAKASEELALKAAAAKAAADKAAADAKRIADAKRAADAAKRIADAKRAADAKKVADAAAAKAKADADAKRFNPDDILKKIETTSDDGRKQLLEDKAKARPQPVAGGKNVAQTKGPQAGAPEGRDTLNEGQANRLVSILKQQIERCWNINAGLDGAAKLIPVFEFQLNRDGSLRGEPRLVNPDGAPAFQDAANSALRALKACQPYRDLPPDMYVHWENWRFRFDPSASLR